MDHGGVIAAAECLADLDQLHFQQLTGEIHRDLARHREGLDPGL